MERLKVTLERSDLRAFAMIIATVDRVDHGESKARKRERERENVLADIRSIERNKARSSELVLRSPFPRAHGFAVDIKFFFSFLLDNIKSTRSRKLKINFNSRTLVILSTRLAFEESGVSIDLHRGETLDTVRSVLSKFRRLPLL